MIHQITLILSIVTCVFIFSIFGTTFCTASSHVNYPLSVANARFYSGSDSVLFLIILVISVVINLVLIIILTKRLIDLSKIKENLSRSSILHLEQATRLNQIKAHFIFNALMPLQNHIIKSNTAQALEYLGTFSQLIRSMLKISRAKYISIDQEIIFLHNFLIIQQNEKSGKFDFEIVNNVPAHISSKMLMPAILLQPLVENAINHGISEDANIKGMIGVTFAMENTHTIRIGIFDNGKGFSRNKNMNNNSALDIVEERIELLNKQPEYKLMHYNKVKDGFEIVLYITIKSS